MAEADAAWRQAKARVIELETGVAPEWADSTGTDTADPHDTADPTSPPGADEPNDDT